MGLITSMAGQRCCKYNQFSSSVLTCIHTCMYLHTHGSLFPVTGDLPLGGSVLIQLAALEPVTHNSNGSTSVFEKKLNLKPTLF